MEFLHQNITYKIRGCIFSVYNQLGFGHKEDIYQKALAIEMEKAEILFEQQKSLPIIYENKKVGTYKPDFVVENKIIVEIKAVPFMPKSYETQLIYYLKGTNYQLGFLVNFGSSKLDIRRKIWTPVYKPNQ